MAYQAPDAITPTTIPYYQAAVNQTPGLPIGVVNPVPPPPPDTTPVVGPFVPAQGPDPSQPQLTTPTTRGFQVAVPRGPSDPAPTKAKAPGIPTVNDIAAGKVPGWGLTPNGFPIATDPAVAQDLTYVDQTGQRVSLPAPQGKKAKTSGAGTTTPASSSDMLATNPQYANQNISGQQARNMTAAAEQQRQRQEATAQAQAGQPPPGWEYLQPGELQTVIENTNMPMVAQLNWIADQMDKQKGLSGLAQATRQTADYWKNTMRQAGARSYVMNLPTANRSAAAGAGDLILTPGTTTPTPVTPAGPSPAQLAAQPKGNPTTTGYGT